MNNIFNAGQYVNLYGYKSFSPNTINSVFDWQDKNLTILLSEAMRMLGELNAFSQLIPDVDFFIKMNVLKEATTSNRIEGTKTNIDEAVLQEEEIQLEEKNDWQEVQNYTKALNYAIKRLHNIPLSMRLLKETHKILLNGVRGKHKFPGEIRITQNWIGGTSPANAFFVPPHHHQLPNLLSDLELFWYNKRLGIPEIIKIALSHYQFETIHPFLDGNGRIGRLLITLQLVKSDILSTPTLYLSDYFVRNKNSYYEMLTITRNSHNVESWIKFFLQAVIATAKKSKMTFQKIIKLRQVYEEKFLQMSTKASKAKILIEHMYVTPILNVKDITQIINSTYGTANNLVKDLQKLKILKETTGSSRNRLYALEDYLSLFRD